MTVKCPCCEADLHIDPVTKAVIRFEEHEKRVWSCDFSPTDPTRLASGSDDTKVKIWATNQQQSACTIDSKAEKEKK